MAPPPYIGSDPVEAIYRGSAPPIVVNELGHGRTEIRQAWVEFEGEVYPVQAQALSPAT